MLAPWLKQPVGRFFLILYLFQHAFSEANSTSVFQPSSVNHRSSEPFWLETPAGYGSDDLYDDRKKPPHGYGGVAALHHSRWLVPVLGYSMIAQGDRLRFQVVPVITWLAVVLETTANMWFHDQLVRDWMDRQGAKVIGDPVFMAEVADNDTSATGPASGSVSGSVSGKSGQKSAMEVMTSPINSTTDRSPEDNKGHEGDDGEDSIIHLCGCKSCPACNHESCHCPDCSAPIEPNIEDQSTDQTIPVYSDSSDSDSYSDSDTPEGSPAPKKIKTEKIHKTTSAIRNTRLLSPEGNIVSLLRQGEYAGQLQTGDKLFLGIAALRRRQSGKPELEFTIRTCNPADEPEGSGGISGVIPLENGNLLSWTPKGKIKIWSVRSGPFLSDEIPVKTHIQKVFVIDNDHIVVWTGKRFTQEQFQRDQLKEWKKEAGSWHPSIMVLDIAEVEQLPNRQLVTFTRKNWSLGVWATGKQRPEFAKLQEGDYVGKIFVVSETQFITYSARFITQPSGLSCYQQFFRWKREDENWTREKCYSTCCGKPDLYVLSDQTLFVVETWQTPAQAWLERSGQRSELPQAEFSLFRFLPDKRLYITGNMYWGICSLNLLSLVEGKWQITELYGRQDEECLFDIVTLDNERLVLAINRNPGLDDLSVQNTEKHSIWMFYEEQGAWHRVLLGYSDSEFTGMAVQHCFRLITWHGDGTIKAWSLFP